MPDPENTQQRRSRATLLLVVALFVLPVVIAWWMAVVRPPTGDALLNHGLLVEPPIDVQRDTSAKPLREVTLAPSEWALLYLSDGACAAHCVKQLGVLSTIRELLGNAGGRVHVGVLVDTGTIDLPRVQTVVSPTARAYLAETLAARVPGVTLPGIVFLDWRAQLMMIFPDDARPGDIKSDLKRLLRASAIR